MEITCKTHTEEVIKQWMEEDIAEIDNLVNQKIWVKEKLDKHALNKTVRIPLQQHLDDLEHMIDYLKKDLEINYAQTYNILPEEVKNKARS